MNIWYAVEHLYLLLSVDSGLADQHNRALTEMLRYLFDQLIINPIREQPVKSDDRPRQVSDVRRYIERGVECRPEMPPVGAVADHMRVRVQVLFLIEQT